MNSWTCSTVDVDAEFEPLLTVHPGQFRVPRKICLLISLLRDRPELHRDLIGPVSFGIGTNVQTLLYRIKSAFRIWLLSIPNAYRPAHTALSMPLSRLLGQHENFFRSRKRCGFYRNFTSVATYSFLLTDLLLIYAALRKTFLDHPVLACNVFLDGPESIMRSIASIKLGDVLTRYSDAEFPDFSSNQKEQLFDVLCCQQEFELYVEKPLFKLFHVGDFSLAVSFEHTIADGIVASAIHEILLENLVWAKSAGQTEAQIDSESVLFEEDDLRLVTGALPPPIDAAMEDPSLDLTDGNQEHYSKIVPENPRWPGFPPQKSYSVAFKSFNIPPKTVKSLLALCKSEGVTLTSYFTVAQAYAFQHVFGDTHHLSTLVAVTLRRFFDTIDISACSPGGRILGNSAHMGIAEKFTPVSEILWDRVRIVDSHLRATVANRRLLHPMYAFYKEADMTSDNAELFFPLLENKIKGDTTKISNLGLVGAEEFSVGDEVWKIDDMFFAQDMAPAASDFMINVVTTKTGGMNIVTSFMAPAHAESGSLQDNAALSTEPFDSSSHRSEIASSFIDPLVVEEALDTFKHQLLCAGS